MTKTEYFLMRREKKIKLKDISEATGISVSQLSMYENGKANLSVNRRILYESYIINK